MHRLVRAMLVVAAVLAPAAAFGGERSLRVDVDGEVRSVTTYATAAPEVLRRAGVHPGERDLVVPAGDLPADGVVRFRSGKPVRLVLDGDARTVWVHGLTVGEALAELGMRPGDADFLSPSPGEAVERGMRIELRNAVTVSVRADGKARDVVSSAPTVRELLRDAGVQVGRRDRVLPGLDTTPAPDARVRVIRVRTRNEEKRSAIPHGTREEKDPKLEKGRRRVADQGADGLRVRTYAVTLEDGKAVARKLLSDKVVRKPRDRVVRVGTAQPAYRGGSSTESGIASWFRADGMTAAHRTLPFGTVVHVTNLDNGKTVNVVVRDRGPFVEGRVIDLSHNAFEEIAPLGQGTARVKISW